MIKNKLFIIYITGITFALLPLTANAQFTDFGSSQDNNQGYNQGGYNQGYGQGSYNQGYGQGSYNQGYGQQNLPPLQGRVMVAPAGTSLNVTTTTALSSAISGVGEPFSTRLASDLYAGGALLLPAGSVIEGQVTQSQPAGRASKNGVLGVRFTTAITPNGQRVPISARLATQDGTGLIRGGTAKGTVGKTFLRGAGGAAAGAALGTALAPAAGGRVGKGAVYGTAIGGGIGLLSTFAAKGREAELPGGSQLQIVLDQPLTLNGSSNQQSQNYGNSYNNYDSNSNYGGNYNSGY